MPRPKNQVARRAQLISAAARTVLEHGADGARLRDIAEQAGVTPASVLYYYPDVQELFIAVFESGVDTYCIHREQEINKVVGAWAQLQTCIRFGVARPGETLEATRLLFALLPVVLRHADSLPLQRELLTRQAALYERILRDGQRDGTFRLTGPAPRLARDLLALEDGYDLGVISGTDTADETEERLCQYARLVTGLDSRHEPIAGGR